MRDSLIRAKSRPHAICATSANQEGQKRQQPKHGGTLMALMISCLIELSFFVPWPATEEAASRFQEPREEFCKAYLNLLSHRNCFHRGRALLLNWSSDRQLKTRVQYSCKQCCSSPPDPPLALSTHTGPSSKSDTDLDSRFSNSNANDLRQFTE